MDFNMYSRKFWNYILICWTKLPAGCGIIICHATWFWYWTFMYCAKWGESINSKSPTRSSFTRILLRWGKEMAKKKRDSWNSYMSIYTWLSCFCIFSLSVSAYLTTSGTVLPGRVREWCKALTAACALSNSVKRTNPHDLDVPSCCLQNKKEGWKQSH